MYRQTIRFFLVALVFIAAPVRADVLVLVHGYLGSPASWEYSGINSYLEANGWPRAGVLLPRGRSVHWVPAKGAEAKNKTYTVELPSIAPIMFQTELLGESLRWINNQHRDEPIILVGHSAGGVVARAAIVRNSARNIKSLITIASPHLGTYRAIQALDYTDDGWPFSWVKEFFSGDTYDLLEDSRGVLIDLVPPYPGNFLHWLNAHPHQDVHYASILRSGPVGLGDELIPIVSQDMNAVPALRGKSTTLVVASGHRLHPGDGAAILGLIAQK